MKDYKPQNFEMYKLYLAFNKMAKVLMVSNIRRNFGCDSQTLFILHESAEIFN